jgi:hypothetical protein
MKTKKVAFTTFFLLLVLAFSSTSALAQQRGSYVRRVPIPQRPVARGVGIISGLVGAYQEYKAWRYPPKAYAPTYPRPRGNRCVYRSCY